MQKIRYYTGFTLAFLLRFKGLLFTTTIIGIIAFLILNLLLPRFFLNETKIIGLTGRVTTENLPTGILELIGEGLTKLGPDGFVEPGLASNWETSDKGKTWTFHLKEAVWQDSETIKASDLHFQFSDVETEVPDEKTIVFKLKDAFSPFPSVLARPVFKTGFLGTGEWKVSDVSLAGTYIQKVSLQKANGDKIVYKFYPTEERTKLAFKLGHVNTIEDVIDPKPLDSWNTAKVDQEIKENQIVTLFFNNNDDRLKGNEGKNLRQALNYAINKDAFVGKRAISPIPPFSWVYNGQVKPYTYNIDRAKELLGNTKEKIELKLVTTPVLLSVAESIANDWRAIGIDVVVQISSVIPTEFQAYLAILDVPKDPDQYSIWHSLQIDSTNVAKFVNPRIDKLLEDGRIEVETEARKRIYIDFQRFIAEEVPAAFLYHPVTYTISRK